MLNLLGEVGGGVVVLLVLLVELFFTVGGDVLEGLRGEGKDGRDV